MYKLVAIDLDGTMLNQYGIITEKTKKAISKAQQSLSYANSMDKKLAEAAEPGLFALSGNIGSVIRYAGALAGSYNVGQGGAKIADGKYSEGAVQVVNGTLMIAPVLTEAKYVLGRLEGAGAVKGANFAQSRIRADQSFSAEGKANYSKLAGYPINTIDDLASAIQTIFVKKSKPWHLGLASAWWQQQPRVFYRNTMVLLSCCLPYYWV